MSKSRKRTCKKTKAKSDVSFAAVDDGVSGEKETTVVNAATKDGKDDKNDEKVEISSPVAVTPKDEEEGDKGKKEISSSSSYKKDKKVKKKKLKKTKKKQLRSRNSGMGLSISATGTAADGGDDGVERPKKITFSDDFEEETENAVVNYGSDKEEDKDDKPQRAENRTPADSENEEDDDVVEEVKSEAARAEAMHQREAERVTKKKDTAARKKKRKRHQRESHDDEKAKGEVKEHTEVSKPAAADEDHDEDDLPDDFFDKVDSEMQSERDRLKEERRKKKKIKALAPMIGRHTTFTSSGGDENNNATPIQAGHGIEVVPLGDDQHSIQPDLSTKLGTKPSKAAIFFSRGSLLNREEAKIDTTKRGFQKKKSKKKDENWKRSKRMTYQGFEKLGAPAVNFVCRKN